MNPIKLKRLIGRIASFSCASVRDTEWIYYPTKELQEHIKLKLDDTVLEINPVRLFDSGLYACYGFDQNLGRHFVTYGELIPIGE